MPLNIDLQQILLHLFNFVILAGGLYFLLYKPVKNFMDKRTEYFQQMNDETAQKLESAKKKEAEYQELIDNAQTHISEQKKKAADDAKALSQSILDDANRQKDQIISQAHEMAQREREKAVQNAREDIVELAAATAEKLIRSRDQESSETHAGSKEQAHE